MTPDVRSAYHVVCECGAHVTSHERETQCEACGRVLVFEWGKDPLIVVDGAPAKVMVAIA